MQFLRRGLVLVVLQALCCWGLDVQLQLPNGGREIAIQAFATKLPPQNRWEWDFSIVNEGGENLCRFEQQFTVESSINTVFPLPDTLPERSRLRLKVRLQNKDQSIHKLQEVPFATPPRPLWREFVEGIPGSEVPAPWLPVELQGSVVKVWGRNFHFAEHPLPVQIESQGEALLAAPMQVILQPAPLWILRSKEKVDDTCVRFHWQGKVPGLNGLSYQALTEVYFDGVIRFDLTVPQALPVERYAIEIPYLRSRVKYIHRGPWQFGGIKTGYPLPEQYEAHPIRNVFHLLSEDSGFAWFDAMPFSWPLANPGRALELLPEKKQVVLKINYIDQPGNSSLERRFSCGFQAFPARPMPEKCDEMQMSYAVVYSDEDPIRSPAWTAPVEYDGAGNINIAQGTVELQVKTDFASDAAKKGEEFFHTMHGRYRRLSLGNDLQDGVYLQIYEHGQRLAYLKTGKFLPSREWCHIAFSWGDELKLYLNGVLSASLPYSGSSSVEPVLIRIGGPRMLVDDLHISKSNRTQFYPNSPAVADEQTLLLDSLDHCEYRNGRLATIANKISEDAEYGYLTPKGELGPGRWGQGTAAMSGSIPSMIEGYAMLGAKALMFHASQPTDEACAGLYIKQPEAFRKTVAAIHDNGMKALVYVNNSISNFDRLWDAYQNEWLITPRGQPFIPAANAPREKCYQACPRSEYIDYFFWRVANIMDEFEVDGVFLDGRMYSSCDNDRHGCGVTDFAGVRRPERNVWDGRMKAWRLYNLVKARNGYCEQHKSSLWDAPTCFFWDGIWEGEQFMNMKVAGRKKLDILPLQAFRMLLTGFPFGMPTRFCSYLYQPFSAIENCTFAFIHGTTWTHTYRINEMQVLAPYWKALEDFGANYHNFLPYWAENNPALQTPDELVKVSAYHKPGSALLLIANFNEEQKEISGKIQINPAALHGELVAVYDAFSGEKVPFDKDNAIPVRISSFRQAWYLLELR